MIKSQYSQILIAVLLQCLFFLYPLSGNAGILFILFYASPLPLYLIGIIYSWKISALTAVLSSLLIYYQTFKLFGLTQVVLYSAIFAIPAIYFTYLINLNRKLSDETEDIAWYPLSYLISKILITSMLLAIIGVLFLGTNFSDYQAAITSIYSNVYQIRPDLEQAIQLNTIELISASLPVLFVIFWVFIFICNLWISLKLASLWGYLNRPWPNFDQINLPTTYIYALLLFMVLSYLTSGIFQIISISITFSILVGYSICGLSILHNVTKDIRLRPVILTALYTIVLIFIPFIIPITILGILNYKKNLRDIIKKRR